MICKDFGIRKTAIVGMDAIEFGNALNYTKMGELHIGLPENMGFMCLPMSFCTKG